MSARLVLVGAGGHAREILDIAGACAEAGRGPAVAGYVVDAAFAPPGGAVRGLPVLGDLAWLAAHAADLEVVCAVGAPRLRRAIAARVAAAGARFASLVHPSAILARGVRLGRGAVVGAACVLSDGVVLEDHVHVYPGCVLSHDVHVGEATLLCPRVTVAGWSRVGAAVFLGAGATLADRVSVGDGAVLGAGAVVVADVPPDVVAAGVPARVLRAAGPAEHGFRG